MRRIVGLGLILLGAVPVWAGTTTVQPGSAQKTVAQEESPPAHPATADQVYEILRLTGTDPMKRQMIDEMLPYLKRMMPYMPEDVVSDLETSLKTADFQGAMVGSFQQHLSMEDAAAILAFYESPAGQRMIAVMPRILDEGQKAGSDLGQKVMFQVIQRHKAEIDRAAENYRAAHATPDVNR